MNNHCYIIYVTKLAEIMIFERHCGVPLTSGMSIANFARKQNYARLSKIHDEAEKYKRHYEINVYACPPFPARPVRPMR